MQTHQHQQESSLESQPLPSQTSPTSLITGENLVHLLEHREELKAQLDALSSELEGIHHILRTELAIRGERKLEIDRFTVTQVQQAREYLSKEKLLGAGVTLKQLQQGTESRSSEYLRVFNRAK